MITFWRQNGVQGLRRLIDQGMGYQITWTLELLARNALLSSPFATYGTGTGTLFNTVEASDIMTTQKIRDMWLGLEERGVPYAMNSSFQTPGRGNVFCITSPGVIADLIDEASSSVYGLAPTFTDVSLYADPSRALNGEVGTYQGVRFIRTNNACLYNAGDITVQTTIAASVSAGDGAPDPASTTVDSVWKVGQTAATHTITVADSTGFSADDFVTIHTLRTSNYGVTNGVNWLDGKAFNARIASVPDGTHLVLTTPFPVDYTTELGTSVYGYVTKGRNIHTAVFLSGANFDGVINGVMQPPLIHTPDPVDDRQVQYRFTWDAYLKYQLWNPASYEVLFLAGSNRLKGARYIS